MASYQLGLNPSAKRDLSRLDAQVVQGILKKLNYLAANCTLFRHKALSGPWKGCFKLRIGTYRAIYTLDHTTQKITIYLIRHRREIYKTP